MARGPRRKLPAMARLEGNPGNRAIFDSGIESLGEPFVPEHLMEDARGCIEVIKESMPPKVYSRLDSFLLAAFGMAWAVHKYCAHRIADPEFEWVVVNSQGNQTTSPWIKMMNTQASVMASLGDRLGLDPKSRAGLRVNPKQQAQSKFGTTLGGHRPSSTLSSN